MLIPTCFELAVELTPARMLIPAVKLIPNLGALSGGPVQDPVLTHPRLQGQILHLERAPR
jgi:hypothetical protein